MQKELLKLPFPILFDDEMVIKTLNGNKTQFRIVVKEPVDSIVNGNVSLGNGEKDNETLDHFVNRVSEYKKGDVLYVKESFWRSYDLDRKLENEDDGVYNKENEKTFYKADYNKNNPCFTIEEDNYGEYSDEDGNPKWSPAVEMLEQYSRILMRITNIRVEMLQNIKKEDCLCEGIGVRKIPHIPPSYIYRNYDIDINDSRISAYSLGSPYASFTSLWNSTALKGYKWEDNPCVLVYDFECL